jgi:hypothetical protein
MLCRCRCRWSHASGRHCSRAAPPGGPAAVASNLKGSLRVPEGPVPTAGSVTQTRVGWARDSGIRPGHTGGPVPLLQFGPPRSLNILPKTVNHTMSTWQMLSPCDVESQTVRSQTGPSPITADVRRCERPVPCPSVPSSPCVMVHTVGTRVMRAACGRAALSARAAWSCHQSGMCSMKHDTTWHTT